MVIDGRPIFSDDVLKNSVEETCRGVLSQWTSGEPAVLQLRDVLALVPSFSSLGRPLAGLIDSLIALDIDPRQEYQETAANTAWCLGSSMLALSKLKGWHEGLDIGIWFRRCLNRYSWSSKVLEGLVSISHLS